MRQVNSVDIGLFLDRLSNWARSQPDVLGIALVGSHARGTATLRSDIDLVVLSTNPERRLDGRWVESFGTPLSLEIEDYGPLKSLRVHHGDGREVEFGVSGS